MIDESEYDDFMEWAIATHPDVLKDLISGFEKHLEAEGRATGCLMCRGNDLEDVNDMHLLCWDCREQVLFEYHERRER